MRLRSIDSSPRSMCLCAALAWPLMMLAEPARCAVQVIVGATPIIDGEAKAAADITVMNERLAFALAVGSPVPYGVPRGAIIDVAPVINGTAGRDCVVFADFIPNNWSAWPNTYQHIDILERGPQRVVVRAVRDWGQAQVATLYTLESNADAVAIQTTLTNGGSAPLADLLSGLTLWPKRGHFFGVPGVQSGAEQRMQGALADRVVAYDEDWSVTLHAPYADHIADGSMDMYRLHSLAPGESRVFNAWLQVGSSGDLRPVVAAEIARKHLGAGAVHGLVRTRDGQSVDAPIVVIEKQGRPYAWAVGAGGAYEMTLPAGDYAAYATAKNFSQSRKAALHVTAGSRSAQDFRDLQSPGRIEWRIAGAGGRPLDARISIAQGQQPVVEYLGRRNFFTELERKGRSDVAIAPGDYVFTISAGGGFLSRREAVKVRVAAGETTQARASIRPLFDPPSAHWYAADLHHHADQAEAVTPPAYLARSQLAAGLDVLFVSDHDSTVNHRALQAIADARGVAFIPAAELSASWGHFNAYPLSLGGTIGIDTATASVGDLIAAGRRQGAVIIQVNHPFIPYGYFTSVRDGVAPGGFDPGFDLIEINAAAAADDFKVLRGMWDFWNAGHHYYLSGGTDTHDVWRGESGSVRTFAHIDGPVTAESFAQSLKAGHAYVTSGPLVFPSVMFGDEMKVKPHAGFTLGFDLQSVAGVKNAQLIGGGLVLKTPAFAAAPLQVHLDFPLSTPKSTWYALIVEDVEGHKAYTDPIWVDAVEAPADTVPAP